MKKKILIIVTAMVLAIAMMPAMAFAGTSSDEVTVKFSAGAAGSFDMVDESITANGNLAEIFFPAIKDNEPDGVSFADVMVAAHIKKYGVANVQDYLGITNGEYGSSLDKLFGRNYAMFYQNGLSSWSISDVVKTGDVLFAGTYTDTSSWSDVFTSFDQKTYKSVAGKQISVKVTGSSWSGVVAPTEVKLTTVNKNTGKFTTLKTTYTAGTEDGTAKAVISTAGIHYLSAIGTASGGPCVGALAKVTVGLDKAKITKKTAKKKQIALKWKKVTGAEKYQVYRAVKKAGKYKKVGTTIKTSFTNKKLKTNKKYFYKIRAIAVSGGKTYKGAFSAIAGVKTKK